LALPAKSSTPLHSAAAAGKRRADGVHPRARGKSLADNIRVVGINPGPVGTDRHVTLLKTRAKNQFGDENATRSSRKAMPLGRARNAREIGDLDGLSGLGSIGTRPGVIYTVDGGIRGVVTRGPHTRPHPEDAKRVSKDGPQAHENKSKGISGLSLA